MLSVILRRIFLSLAKKIFFGKLLRPFVSVNNDLLKFSLFEVLMRMLRLLCAHWPCGSGTDARPDHTHHFLTSMLSMRISFPIFKMLILCTLSMRVRIWCVGWANESGTDAFAEHTHPELMRILSKGIKSVKIPNLKRSLQHMLSARE